MEQTTYFIDLLTPQEHALVDAYRARQADEEALRVEAEAKLEQEWEDDQAERAAAYSVYELWCEAGAHASGLPCPASRPAQPTQEHDDGSDDIVF